MHKIHQLEIDPDNAERLFQFADRNYVRMEAWNEQLNSKGIAGLGSATVLLGASALGPLQNALIEQGRGSLAWLSITLLALALVSALYSIVCFYSVLRVRHFPGLPDSVRVLEAYSDRSAEQFHANSAKGLALAAERVRLIVKKKAKHLGQGVVVLFIGLAAVSASLICLAVSAQASALNP